MSAPTPVELKMLTAALERHDSHAAVRAITAISAATGSAAADRLLDGLIACGLDRLADQLKAGDPAVMDALRRILTSPKGDTP